MNHNKLLMASSLIQTTIESLDYDKFAPQIDTLKCAVELIVNELPTRFEPDCPECGGVANPVKVDHAQGCSRNP